MLRQPQTKQYVFVPYLDIISQQDTKQQLFPVISTVPVPPSVPPSVLTFHTVGGFHTLVRLVKVFLLYCAAAPYLKGIVSRGFRLLFEIRVSA